MACRLLGVDDLHKLRKDHMYALDEVTAKITGVHVVYDL